MTILTVPASFASLLAELYMLYLFIVLSRKLGAVTKMKPYYRWLYGASVLICVALVAESIRLTSLAAPAAVPAAMQSNGFYLLAFEVPLASAAIIAFVVVLLYWGWLFREPER